MVYFVTVAFLIANLAVAVLCHKQKMYFSFGVNLFAVGVNFGLLMAKFLST